MSRQENTDFSLEVTDFIILQRGLIRLICHVALFVVILLQLHKNSGEKEDFKVIDSASQKEQTLAHISRRDLSCAAKVPINCAGRHSRRREGVLV